MARFLTAPDGRLRTTLQLSAAHFMVDSYSSMLGAFLPFLRDKLNLTLLEAGLLGGVLVFSSSLMQPLYGYLADLTERRVFVALGPAIAGIFICAMGRAPDFPSLLLLVFAGGAGIAAFHPQGASYATRAGGSHGRQLSLFIGAGMLGYAVGPIYITGVILLGGLGQSYWAALPGIAMSLYLLAAARPQRPPVAMDTGRGLAMVLARHRSLLGRLYLLVVLRSVIQLSFVSFLPLYMTDQGLSALRANQYLSLFLLAGAISTFLGGSLADRFGERRLIVWSMALCFPLLELFLVSDGSLRPLLCAGAGASLLVTNAINLSMAQKLVPEASGTVSALMMGFAWGMAGLFVPVAGLLSEYFGLQITLMVYSGAALMGFGVALSLPSTSESAREEHLFLSPK